MDLIQVSRSLDDYLECTEYCDFRDRLVAQACETVIRGCVTQREKALRVFEFVRDKIPHSYDIDEHSVTVTAREVLLRGHGICHAKSNLFVAMLRYIGVPAGFCYQRLVCVNETESHMLLHGIAALRLTETQRWTRVDASINAADLSRLHLKCRELLVFYPQAEKKERDYPYIFSRPLPTVIAAMKSRTDCMEYLEPWFPSEIPEEELPKI